MCSFVAFHMMKKRVVPLATVPIQLLAALSATMTEVEINVARELGTDHVPPLRDGQSPKLNAAYNKMVPIAKETRKSSTARFSSRRVGRSR